jgi:hypothetical protein
MSITTMGWGGGAITTQGWGVGLGVIIERIDEVRFGFSGDLKHLVLQLRALCQCKISTADLQAQAAASHTDLDLLDSSIAQVEAKLRNLEGEYWLAEHVEYLTDGKIGTAALQNRIAADATEMDTIESLVAQAGASLRNLQSQIRNELVQRRTP